MPQGDRRGSAYEFYDWTYDGEWIGNMLRNGLGCLTDGDYGPANFKLSYYAQSEYSSTSLSLIVSKKIAVSSVDKETFLPPLSMSFK